MANEKKKIKRVIGCSLIVIAGVTLFYQYRFSKVQESSKEYIAVATKQIDQHHQLTEENVRMVQRNKSDILEGNLSDMKLVIGSIAKETIYKNEDINVNRIVSEEEYKKKGFRLISIKVSGDKDALVGFDVKPNDKVDILFYDSEGVYEGKPYLEEKQVFDLKSAEGISYVNRGDGFVPSYALIWVEKDIAEDIYERQEQGGYFKFQLHIDRAKEEKNILEKNILEEQIGG